MTWSKGQSPGRRQPMMRAHIPGVPPRPGEPGWPPTPPVPLVPGPVPPTRVWLDPHADWKNALYERLLAKRIVLAMGILDVLRVPVHACVSGEINGPALGVLASCPRRSGYPNATFVLAEPRLRFGGTVTAVTVREQQLTRMLDTLYFRLADV